MLKLLKTIGISLLILLLLLIMFFLFRPDPWIYSSNQGNHIRYSGRISFEGYEKLIEIYSNAKEKPSTLEITSGGGNGLAGILIGRFLQEKGMDIKIRRFCASSCANYVFPAGKKKRLSNDSLIVYHGGMLQKNLLNKMLTKHKFPNIYNDSYENKEAFLLKISTLESKLKHKFFADKGACAKPDGIIEVIVKSAQRCLKFRQKLERDFFAQINVDPKLPYYGQIGDYKARYKSYEYIGFYYDLKSLSKMGVNNIEVIGGEWVPSQNRNFKKVYKVTL
ncbi:hypothetical protein [Thalassotalea sp. PP2-459]|uniref:hypothetical protein n=1 Tax=Thalassotalea sp. PP2-459 TaxID=1742724 RepID=UPI000943F863|nr:hypothetical protein [Thalassotalea sp. PP2-459]OKY25182.1 hypothetical protein BI291_04020 [Thalassotalea sp. PP2-459]